MRVGRASLAFPFLSINIPYPTAGRKGKLLFIPTNLHNQIRQIGSRRGPAIRGYIPDWQQVTPWHMRMYRRDQISQDSRRQDHRLQDLPECRHKWRYQSRERSCYLVKLTKLYAKKACCPESGISDTLKESPRCRRIPGSAGVCRPFSQKCAKVRTKKRTAVHPDISDALKRLRGFRSEPWAGRSGGLDAELSQNVAQRRMPAECPRRCPGDRPPKSCKNAVRKTDGRQIGGYGNKSNTLKGEPGTVRHPPTDRQQAYKLDVGSRALTTKLWSVWLCILFSSQPGRQPKGCRLLLEMTGKVVP